MAEIAGVVLGGIPIALLALERYHDPVKSYWKYDTTLSTLRSNIFVQQQQLLITLGLLGLEQPGFNEIAECLKDKYPSQHKEILSIVARMDKITKNLLDKLEIDTNGKVRTYRSTPIPLCIKPALFRLPAFMRHPCHGLTLGLQFSLYGHMSLLNELNGSGGA